MIRGQFRTWLGTDAVTDPGQDLIFAVYEALANIVQHAYARNPAGKPQPSRMRLRALRLDGQILVTVTDDGHWYLPQRPGRGLRLIRGLVTHARIERGGIDTRIGSRVYLHTELKARTSTITH